jgi:hypothetical protein
MATLQTGSRPNEILSTTSQGSEPVASQVPSVAEGSLKQGAVSPHSIRESIAGIAVAATPSPDVRTTIHVRNQDLVNYAYLVVMKEKDITAGSPYQHAADRMKELFGVSLRDILQKDARENRTEIKITEANASIIQKRFARSEQTASSVSQPAPVIAEVSGDKIINALYASAHKLQNRLGSDAARSIGAKDNSEDALVHRLAEIAEIKKHTGHTVWDIALSHRTKSFSADVLESPALLKAVNAAGSHRAVKGEGTANHDRSRQHDTSRQTEAAGTHGREDSSKKESFHASTTVKPGGYFVKPIQDRLVNELGQEIVVERKRFIAGPLSFNLPGKKVTVDQGINPNDAKAIVKEHIRSLSRRDKSN